MIEREKRYNLNQDIPFDNIKYKYIITQVYSNIKPAVRIRKSEFSDHEKFYHTVKYNTEDKNERIEIEQEISKELYESLFKLINKEPIIKERYLIDLGNNLIAEIDHFLDNDMWICEIEFPNEDDMNTFVKPAWIGAEIKNNNKSFNLSLFELKNKINYSVWNKF